MAGRLSAIRALSQELKSLKDEPLEGFRVKLVNDENMFDWEVAIFGPPGTIYQGGYFKARMHFPQDYPFSPPSLRFDKATLLYHPNVYESGDLCISILHPPVNDPHSGELPCERWNPTQSVRTILLSVVSLLNEPNTSSPANVDASVKYRRWVDPAVKDPEYETLVKAQVQASRLEAEKDGVTVPTTLEDYVIKAANTANTKSSLDIDNLYEDDDDDYLDDNNDDQNSTDDSVGGSGEHEQGNSQGTTNNPSDGNNSGQPAPNCPRNKNGGGESFEESLSDDDMDDKDDCNGNGASAKKKQKLQSNSSSK